jgi:serine protease Do
MQSSGQTPFRPRAALLLAIVFASAPLASVAEVSTVRMTPIVRAVRDAAPAVVNIRGQKTVTDSTDAAHRDASREVNGMGTGIIIDQRGYILTNFHVVDGVRNIQITLDDRQQLTAFLVAHDRETDLAIIKIRAGRQLPVIRVGTSSDLLTGETVVALGNAYGYEHTVTQGIISALHRDVQVSDTQAYDDLIQTDASINPGNSGGPLLNLDGDMIGVNVAVRAGAQGIGFAIPVDQAMEVAAGLLNVERLESKWHGIVTKTSRNVDGVVVREVADGSPAEQCGLRPGDTIARVGPLAAQRPLDVERALLGQPAGEPVPVEIRRGDDFLTLDLRLASRPVRQLAATAAPSNADPATWDLLGLALEVEPASTFKLNRSRYQGGMRVIDIRPDSVAANQGIQPGDILVAIHGWETTSDQDMRYIVTKGDLEHLGPVKFWVIRGDDTFFGTLNVAGSTSRSVRR